MAENNGGRENGNNRNDTNSQWNPKIVGNLYRTIVDALEAAADLAAKRGKL
ncbi:hypothetical protein [Salegentibacter sp. 24]|uniref:hypothetical protein n=1 Tax=Salegentibacter sp. 24 TaxID=2183986 RepID=UPI001415006E|nr:hypothetical protein [Salegentibacter sp. 24]